MSLKNFNRTLERTFSPPPRPEPEKMVLATPKVQIEVGRKDVVKVSNFDDLKLPRAVKIKNFDDLEKFFAELIEAIKETFSVDIPTPEVTVNVPELKQPEINVDVDLKPLIEAMEDVKSAITKKAPAPKVESNKKEFSLLAKLLKEIKASLGKKQNVTVHSATSGIQQDEFEASIKRQMSPSGNGSGRQVCTTAGTAEAFSAQACKYAIITGEDDNTDTVCIGRTPVAAAGSMAGISLEPGRSVRVDVSNMNQLKIDSRQNGEGVHFEYFT